MKKFLILSLLATLTLNAATYEDFRKGLDATAFTTLTAARLNQMIDNGTVNTNKGLIIVTNGTPNTASFPHYTNFLWLDTSTQPPVVKVYTSAGGGAWNSIGLGATNVTTDKIQDGAVTSAKIAGDAVDTSKITNNAITSAKLQDGSVTRAKISSSPPAVWPEHFNTGAVGSDALTNAQIIGTSRLVDASVTREKLAAGAVDSSLLTNNAVIAGKLAVDSVYGTNVASGTLTTTNIADNTITTNDLAATINTALGLTLKAGARIDTGGGAPVITRSYNVSGVSYSGGTFTVTLSNNLATANYFVSITPIGDHTSAADQAILTVKAGTQTAGGFGIYSILARTGNDTTNGLAGFYLNIFE